MKNIYATLLTTSALLLAGSSMAQSHGKAGAERLQTLRPAHVRGQVATHGSTLRGGGAPANDECSAAEAITLVPTADCAASLVTGNNGASTITTGDPSCDASTDGYQDVWYSFNSDTNSVVTVDMTNVDGTDWAFTVQPTCDPGAEIACEINPGGPVQVNVTPNTDYYIRVYANTQYGNGGEFTLCVSFAAQGPAPVNDDCTGAVAEDIAVGDPPHMFSGDNTGATEDGGTGFNMVWHAFTTTECANITINYCVPGSEFDNFLVNLAVQCPDFITGVLTGANDSCTVSFQGLAAGTYYIPVLVEAGTTPAGPYSIEVTASTCATPPSNDECAGAVSLIPATTCNPVAATTAGATQSMDPILCNAFTSPNANDAWFSFTATAPNDSILVEGIDDFDAVIEIFSGECGNLTSLACEDSNFPQGAPVTERMFISGLTIGSVYYVRVYDYAHGSADHNFNICVMDDGTIGISDASAPEFTFFPNPTQGDITISGADLNGTVNFELTDMTGRVVYKEQKSMSAGQPVTLALNGKLAQGTYSLRLITAKGISSRPVMIK